MFPSHEFEHTPDAIRTLRRTARWVILWLLWLTPAGVFWLAGRRGVAWELVTLLGVAVAVAASLGCHPSVPGRRARLVLALCLGAAFGLLLGVGQVNGAPSGAMRALVLVAPLGALVLAGGLCDRRALMAALMMLSIECLLPLGAAPGGLLPLAQVGLLAVAALAIVVAQHLVRRAARGPMIVLPPQPRPLVTVWTAPVAVPPAFIVQAERAADGTLRLALAGSCAGRLRVRVS